MFVINVLGRPAPQGSKSLGSAGQMRESSPYLAPWRRAVKGCAYAWFRMHDITPEDLRARGAYILGPVAFSAIFRMPLGVPIDGPPDLDKLLRSTWDALTQARVWEDDGRVTRIRDVEKRHAHDDEPTGAYIEITEVER